MIRPHALVITLGVLAMLLGLAAAGPMPQVPPGHPPAVPPGHPPVPEEEAPAAPEPAAAADPADVASIDAIIGAYYDSISGPKGQQRNWNRFRSLFLPHARLQTARGSGETGRVIVLEVDQFVEQNTRYFERGGYFETEIHRQVDAYGRIAQVLSTYATRRVEAAPKPYSRGINGFQLLRAGGRWWIASVMWDFELPQVNPIPSKYLPEKVDDGS